MKNYKKMIASVLSILMVSAVFAQQNDKFTIQVDGLGCPFCAYGLEKKFKELEGISAISIDMETGIFNFSFPTEKKLSIEKATKKVEEAGYTPVKTIVKRSTGEVQEKDDSSIKGGTDTQLMTASVWVAGNCDMCKARIEKAAMSVAGVQNANWDKQTKQLAIGFDADQMTMDILESTILKSGHELKHQAASEQAYENLPPCCRYSRKNKK